MKIWFALFNVNITENAQVNKVCVVFPCIADPLSVQLETSNLETPFY